MAEDTAAYTLKPGPKAELDSLRTAREESGPIAPRPGACPVRVSPRVHPPHISYVLRVTHTEMKVTRAEMKAARLPLECAQLPLMRTTRAWPFNTPCPASALTAWVPHAPFGQGGRQPDPLARRRSLPRPAWHWRGRSDGTASSTHPAPHAPPTATSHLPTPPRYAWPVTACTHLAVRTLPCRA